MFDTCDLISQTFSQDEIGQQIPIEQSRTVFCEVGSVTRAEFFQAGQSGLKPEILLKVFHLDYRGECVVEIHGARYKVYRTYLADDTMELYCERATGA